MLAAGAERPLGPGVPSRSSTTLCRRRRCCGHLHPGDHELALAGLVHDIGQRLPGGTDETHAADAARAVRQALGERVAAMVGLHVEAKRYLVATEGDYGGVLTTDSVVSLGRQGGAMSAEEAAAFLARPGRRTSLVLRRADDSGKVEGSGGRAGLDAWVPLLRVLSAGSVGDGDADRRGDWGVDLRRDPSGRPRRGSGRGARRWIDGLPDLIAGLERDWAMRVGRAYGDATEAFVCEADAGRRDAGRPKVVVPREGDAAAHEITALRLCGGQGCVALLRHDVGRGALLLERLGPSLPRRGSPSRSATRSCGPRRSGSGVRSPRRCRPADGRGEGAPARDVDRHGPGRS